MPRLTATPCRIVHGQFSGIEQLLLGIATLKQVLVLVNLRRSRYDFQEFFPLRSSNLEYFMMFRFSLAMLMACTLAVSACESTETATSTGMILSSSSSGVGAMGGIGGHGGVAGTGGTGAIPVDDAALCVAIGTANMHESLVAEVDAMNAPLMAAPEIIYDVTIPPSGGFVALKIFDMHTTFAIYVQGVESFEVLLEGSPLVESVNDATCVEAHFRRFVTIRPTAFRGPRAGMLRFARTGASTSLTMRMHEQVSIQWFVRSVQDARHLAIARRADSWASRIAAFR